jgi:hypothetical protein
MSLYLPFFARSHELGLTIYRGLELLSPFRFAERSTSAHPCCLKNRNAQDTLGHHEENSEN